MKTPSPRVTADPSRLLHRASLLVALLSVGCSVDGSISRSETGCDPTQVRCAGACVDPLTNLGYCGADDDCLGANTGEICGDGESCQDGLCVAGSDADAIGSGPESLGRAANTTPVAPPPLTPVARPPPVAPPPPPVGPQPPPPGAVLFQDFNGVELSDGADYFTHPDGTPIDGFVRGLSVPLAEELFLCGGTMRTSSGLLTPPDDPRYSMYIVDSPDGDTSRGKVLRSFSEANNKGGPQVRFADRHPQSGTWDEMYMSMEIYTPAINPFTGAAPQIAKARKSPLGLYGGKLSFEGVRKPGDLAYCQRRSGDALAKCEKKVKADGWSARMVILFTRGYPYQADWMPADYVYDRNSFQKTSFKRTLPAAEANGWPLDEVLLLPGQWYKATLYIKVDEAGAGDGKLRLWVGKVGGQQHLISKRDGLQFSTADYPNKILGSFGLWGYGGGDLSFAVDERQFTYYDNFLLTTVKPDDIPATDVD